MSGQLVPLIAAPTGSVKVPTLLTAVSAESIGGSLTGDLANQAITDTATVINCDVFGSRSVVRDLGNIDANEIGRLLGNAVAKAFDKSIFTALDSATASIDSVPMTVDLCFDAAAQIRGAGEMGALYGFLTPAQATVVLKEIGTAAYAGGDFQGQALMNGYIGMLGGVQWFMSSNITTADTAGYVFGADAMRIAMQRNVDVEVARRAEAVGFDVVASLLAAGALVDASRAVKLINVA